MTDFQKIIAGLVVALFLVAALPTFASDPTREPAKAPAEDPAQEEPREFSLDPVPYTNEGGDFRVIFPGGCGKLVTRANEPDLFGGEEWDDIIQVTYVFCDRFQETGEGCSVAATFNLYGEDGSMPGPEHVIDRVEKALSGFGVNMVSQQAIKKDFGNGIIAEGVEVMARKEEGPGQVWVRGLLINGDIYILAAWKEQGEVWKNPDYITFFNSFQPWTD